MKTIIAAIVLILSSAVAYAQTVILQPSPAPSVGIAPVVSSAAPSSLVIKSTPGNLYFVTVTNGVTAGFLMTFDAASVPADGSVTPKSCVAVAAGATASINYAPSPPERYATGIVAVLSSAGCFTKTSLTGAFMKGLAQ